VIAVCNIIIAVTLGYMIGHKKNGSATALFLYVVVMMLVTWMIWREYPGILDAVFVGVAYLGVRGIRALYKQQTDDIASSDTTHILSE
jgi:hypothetical protein